MTDMNNKNKGGKIALSIFLLVCAGLGIAAFILSFIPDKDGKSIDLTHYKSGPCTKGELSGDKTTCVNICNKANNVNKYSHIHDVRLGYNAEYNCNTNDLSPEGGGHCESIVDENCNITKICLPQHQQNDCKCSSPGIDWKACKPA